MTALYIHWPFCKSKCPYCDFNSHVTSKVDYDRWKQAYLRELDYFAPELEGQEITSVFFGGGTPTLMPPGIAEAILKRINLKPGTEVTMEANPTSVEADTFDAFVQAGINRISLGVQSLREKDLKFLGREHSASEALNAIARAQKAVNRVSLDLIYARPGQTLEAWEAELKEALALGTTHISLYQLTIEKGTPFYSAHQKGEFVMPDDEVSADLYALTNDMLEQAGLPAYEVSNYAKPGHECRHNLAYWRYQEYLGIGPGAHSRISRSGRLSALMMWHRPEQWLETVAGKGAGIQTETALTPEEIKEELLMMGLRIPEGVSRQRFRALLSQEPEEVLNKQVLESLISNGLCILDAEGIRLTPQGRPLVNAVLKRLLT
ncbi:MAG: coproporphyrinogen oxidase [Rickettsiales bacterium]|jgi:oxygen-independent coproporphyrinogen-3 oxidase|nr:coproporphyrinogen oxidase [Rickettsiales bacterium]